MRYPHFSAIPTHVIQALHDLGLKINFSELAKLSTGRRALFKGLLPPIKTLLILLASALVISISIGLWTGAVATAALFLPFYAKTFFAVCGMTLLNFVFNREIQTVVHSAREIREGYIFDKENPTDLRRLVEHLRQELNAYFKEVYGDKHIDMPMPRLLTFDNHHFQIKVVEGMNPWNSAILFSSHVFNSHETNMSQKDLAALVAVQMAKIYMRRGNSTVIVQMGVDLLSTLESIRSNRFGFGILGAFTWPLEFLCLLQRAVRRSHENEAAEIVAKIGRGGDLYHALDTKPCMTLYKRPSVEAMKAYKTTQQRPAYKGPLKTWIGPIIDWPKKHLELTEDHRESPLIWVTVTGLVREFGNHVKELWSDTPRSTRLKEHLITFQVNDIEKNAIRNQYFYEKISNPSRYDVIGPNGQGKAKFDKQTKKVVPKPAKVRESSCEASQAVPIVHLYAQRRTNDAMPVVTQSLSTARYQRRHSIS